MEENYSKAACKQIDEVVEKRGLKVCAFFLCAPPFHVDYRDRVGWKDP